MQGLWQSEETTFTRPPTVLRGEKQKDSPVDHILSAASSWRSLHELSCAAFARWHVCCWLGSAFMRNRDGMTLLTQAPLVVVLTEGTGLYFLEFLY